MKLRVCDTLSYVIENKIIFECEIMSDKVLETPPPSYDETIYRSNFENPQPSAPPPAAVEPQERTGPSIPERLNIRFPNLRFQKKDSIDENIRDFNQSANLPSTSHLAEQVIVPQPKREIYIINGETPEQREKSPEEECCDCCIVGGYCCLILIQILSAFGN